jgi:molecular chaperone Hsp33
MSGEARPIHPTIDDIAWPFAIEGLPVRGRIVRLGPVANRVISAHKYPDVVSRLVGEGLVLVGMLGTALKIDAAMTLQTQSDGPVRMVVADLDEGRIRGLAHYDESRVGNAREEELLGKGSLAFTIDPGGDMERYQGIVDVDGASLVPAALRYFERSEQLPTLVRVAVGQAYTPGEHGLTWRAGGIMVQRLATEGGAAGLQPMDEDDWTRLELLMETVSDDELIDPTLPPADLAYRLFNEDGVRAFTPMPLAFGCRCSRDRVESILKSYRRDEVGDLLDENGQLSVVCEFCNSNYLFNLDDIYPPGTEEPARPDEPKS